MTTLNAIIKPEWIRLLKHDGHLGGVYDPGRGIIRFISRDGTVDIDLVALSEEHRRKMEQQVERKA